VTHSELLPGIFLDLPAEFETRLSPPSLSAVDRTSGVSVLAFARTGLATPEQADAAVLAVLTKRRADARSTGAAVAASGAGWVGQTRTYVSGEGAQALKVVLTAARVDGPQPAIVGVLIEVPQVRFAQASSSYLRFAQMHLRGPAVAAAPAPSGFEFELEPMESKPEAEPAAPRRAQFGERAPMAPPVPPEAIQRSAPPPRAQLKSAAPASPSDDDLLLRAGRGQRALILSIILTFATRGLAAVPGIPALLVLFIAVAIVLYAVNGVLAIGSGFSYPRGQKLLLMAASTIPLVGLIVWIVLSVKTTRRLREAGYDVGLFGVRA
jgi:hypothetical protein